MRKDIDDKGSTALFLKRIMYFQKTLEDHNCGGALLTYSRDILYLTGTAQPSRLAITPEKYILFVKSGMAFVEQETFINKSRVVEEKKMVAIYNHFFSNLANKRIGIQLDIITAEEYLLFRKIFNNVEFLNISPMILTQRSIKDKFEIEQIKKACVCAHVGYKSACSILKPGMSELELSASVEYAHRMTGHEGVFFFRQKDFFISMGPIGSGYNLTNQSGVLYSLTGRGQSASVPIGPSQKKIEQGDTIIIDIPCHINGYHCDQTRSFVAGRAKSETRACYRALKQISDYLIDEVIKPGISCDMIYKSAIKAAKRTKFSKAFLKLNHGEQSRLAGHGIGIEISEIPVIFAGNNQLIAENNVIALELH
ncbi:M24 family metallopeptidase, partial [Desulfobacterales bacterium HSG17]|nr:M24 family metallopeptidase [Desulfobacterales bacterium HSG17]